MICLTFFSPPFFIIFLSSFSYLSLVLFFSFLLEIKQSTRESVMNSFAKSARALVWIPSVTAALRQRPPAETE